MSIETIQSSRLKLSDGRTVESEYQTLISEARFFLDQHVETPVTIALGPVVEKTDIKSSIGPFLTLPEYKTKYPQVVTEALGNLYAQYNSAFNPLLEANREWSTDYQYCIAPDETPINGWVQIDMVGLPDGFLKKTEQYSEAEVREALRGRIFEIENSLAMYQLLESLFSPIGNESFFKRRFRASLDDLRQRYSKQIALLAVTDQKYKAMKESEFGKSAEEPLTDEEVSELSGFDRFFSPDEFQQYLAENGSQCDYLLYVRSSDPVAKLKKPNSVVQVPLLDDDNSRKIIKANAITFNIDRPGLPVGSLATINDTKAYLPPLGMAYKAYSDGDLLSSKLLGHLSEHKPYAEYSAPDFLNPEFEAFLISQGVDLEYVRSGKTALRCKPMNASYGCYGHLSGVLGEKKFRQELRRNMRDRGPYVIQPEMQTPTILNLTDGQTYTYIDRNFFSTDGKNYRFVGGFRSLMPLNSTEAQNGRIHGSQFTVWSEIC